MNYHVEGCDCAGCVRGHKGSATAQTPECRNPNHALTDGSPDPHEIGSSCMAESAPPVETPTFFNDPIAAEITRRISEAAEKLMAGETQETTMPTQEKWEIEVGPITTNQLGEFADVAYAIRYPGGSFRVEQRVNVKQGGYKLAHERIQRIVAVAAPPATETQPVMPEIPSEVFDLVNNLQRRAEDLTGSGATETQP